VRGDTHSNKVYPDSESVCEGDSFDPAKDPYMYSTVVAADSAGRFVACIPPPTHTQHTHNTHTHSLPPSLSLSHTHTHTHTHHTHTHTHTHTHVHTHLSDVPQRRAAFEAACFEHHAHTRRQQVVVMCVHICAARCCDAGLCDIK
jgi:hypothetical protein